MYNLSFSKNEGVLWEALDWLKETNIHEYVEDLLCI